jgi:transposase InsO family protein
MYTSNPFLPKVRRLAVNDVIYRGLSYSQAGRKYGVTKSAICKWMKKADPDHRVFIDTVSSKPHYHPQELDPLIVKRVIKLRKKYNRCAPVLHAYLKKEGVDISLSSVGRILKRYQLTRKPKPPIYGGKNPHRPSVSFPGELVAIDTMHTINGDRSRFYIFAVIDIFSRFGYAEYSQRMTQDCSLKAVNNAVNYCGFPFKMVQADNGPEFRNGFRISLNQKRINLRHTRVRRPNDNAHVERFIRTIQDECFKGKHPIEKKAQQTLTKYLKYYNYERLHLGINLMTPAQIVSKVVS